MVSEITCAVCHGEGKVQSLTRTQKVGVALSRFSEWPANALILSAPISLTAAIFGIAKFPLWLLGVDASSSTAQGFMAVLLGLTTVTGTIIAIIYASHLVETRDRRR